MTCKEVHLFFYKQPVFKQLALGSQIAKQLSGLNINNFLSNFISNFALCNNINYRLKKSRILPL